MISVESRVGPVVWIRVAFVAFARFYVLFLMAIVKRGYRVCGVSSQYQSQAPCNSSIYDDGLRGKHCRLYHDDDDDDDDADSGAASESSDGGDVGEKGTELCRVGEQNCNIPYELFDLPDLRPVLSLDTWNHCLTDEERFGLSAYLPDADQQTFMHTLKELLAGENFHFGSPLVELFDMLKGGLCQPQVARYREGLKYLERKEHYHFLRTYQDSMVSNLLEMRETWERCRHLCIDDRLSIWNLRKYRKALVQAEPQSLPPRLSEQKHKFKHLRKGKIGPLRRSIKMPKLTRDEDLLEVVEPLPKQKASTNKLDGKYSLAGKIHAKTSLEVHSSGTLQLKETEKIGKQFPKGMLKLAKKCVSMKHGWTGMQPEIGQQARFSEMQDLGTKSEPLSLLPPVNKWEADDFVGTMRKTRSRTKINSSEISFSHAKGNQSCNYSNSNAGQERSSSLHGRKLGRIKEQEMYNRIGVRVPLKFSENIGRFKQESNLAGGRAIFEDSEKRRERAKVLEEGMRKRPQELSKEKVNKISSKNSRKYPQERVMFDLYSDAEEQGQNLEKLKINLLEHQKSSTEQYRLPVGHDFAWEKKQSLPFLLKQNSQKELDIKQPEPCKEKKGKTDYFKNLKKLKKKNGAINQSSKDLLRISAKKKKSIEQSLGKHQVECLEIQSALAENRRYALGVSLSLDNSRFDEAKKKKRKQRQIVNEHEGLIGSDSPKEHREIPKRFQRKIQDSEKSDTDEILLSQTEEYEDVDEIGDTKLVSSIHNDAQMSLCLQSGEDTLLQKRPKTDLEEDAEIVIGGVSNRSLGNSQYGLDEQTDKENPLKKMGKKMSKADAVILTGVKGLNGLHGNPRFSPCQELVGAKPLKRGAKKAEDAKIIDGMEESNGIKGSAQPLMCLDGDECKPGNRKARKVKADAEILTRVSELNTLHDNDQPNSQQTDESKPGKKRARKKEDNIVSLATLSSKQAIVADKVTTDTKPSKKLPPLVIPPVVSSFSFSVIHFLSAVRTAMLSPSVEDISEVVNHSEKSDGERESSNQEGQFTFSSDGKAEDQNCVFLNCRLDGHPDTCKTGIDPSYLERERHASPSSIPFQEIVKRVQMNPGDPCILETQEPLQDLVRGALKIFTSKTAPPGIKGWKPLAVYDKSTRSWSWIGPVLSSSPWHESIEIQTSPEAWGISQKMLLKLVEAFANWLKNGQETLQQIVLLPTPPPPSMSTCIDEKERFRDLRAQKSSITITPSSADIRAYFRREEFLRYSVPDRAFSYTAVDGRKAVVAPLRRCGGKPTSKARDHFMLKPDRPPHVTILCLVRDAAARLPGSIGTRADVCTLIRDSQYIVEDVSDAQVNQVVSGALDRLHYERDPCVQFDGDRKLWVYLHSERAEEDFEDDGTSSTKRWKRQKKDNVENSDLGPCNDGTYHGMDDQDACGSGLGFDFCSPDYNGDSSSIYSGGKAELVYNKNGSLTSPRVLRSGFNGSNMDDGMVPFIDLPPSIHSIPGSMHESHPMGWEVLGLNPLGHGSNLKSQEHISNKDFDNDTFSRERPIELVSASLL